MQKATPKAMEKGSLVLNSAPKARFEDHIAGSLFEALSVCHFWPWYLLLLL